MDSQGGMYFTSLIRNGVNLDDENEVNHDLDSAAGYQNQPSDASQFTYEAELARGNQFTYEGVVARGYSRRSGSFTQEEDELLVSAWLNISMDPIHGNGQKSGKYWDRVHEYFHNHRDFTSDRTSNSLLNRWSSIQQAVNKFCGCIAQINERRQSGINDQDRIEQAKLMYSKMYDSTFNLEHCWNKLKLAPKWLEDSEKKKTKKPKKTKKHAPNCSSTPDPINLEEESTQNHPTTSIERPPGTQGEKERLKRQRGKEAIDDRLVGLIEEMRQEKKITSSRKIELMENLMTFQQRQLTFQQRQEEDRIMAMDLSAMSPVQVEYYTRRQKEILNRMH